MVRFFALTCLDLISKIAAISTNKSLEQFKCNRSLIPPCKEDLFS